MTPNLRTKRHPYEADTPLTPEIRKLMKSRNDALGALERVTAERDTLRATLEQCAAMADKRDAHAVGTYWPGCQCPPCFIRAELAKAGVSG